jgi:hypothetical protein
MKMQDCNRVNRAAPTRRPENLFDPVWYSPLGAAPALAPDPSHAVFTRVMSNIPLEQRLTFTALQLRWLAIAMTPRQGSHIIEYRTSIPYLFGQRFYLTIFFGRERRNLARLLAEGQLNAKRIAALYGLCAGMGAIVFATIFVITVYITKSAIGIDVFDGPSPLHDFVFNGRAGEFVMPMPP